MLIVIIISWAFAAYLAAFAGVWVYAVLWIIWTMVRGK